MATFSQGSLDKLSTCEKLLQILFLHVVTHYDCTVIEGYRGKDRQDKYFEEGVSKVKWPNGKHNKRPSKAIDVAPYISGKGIVWSKNQCYNFAGFVLGVASMMGINVRWGGDWDRDRDIKDQSFNDLVHFELAN